MNSLDPHVQSRVEEWLNGPYDRDTQEEIRRLLTEDPQRLADAFFKNLSFGTGGMRGIMGVGTNRINIYTIRSVTQGLASYVKRGKVFVGYDTRHHSREFAEETAKVLAGNGIRVFIAKEICPTPLTSFACRHYGCSAAVMITASHNPPEYNGYKVYWSDGGQVVPPHDEGIMEEIAKGAFVQLGELDSPLISWVGGELDEAYLKELKRLQIWPEWADQSLSIVYSNLHGTGIRLVPAALKSWGYETPVFVEKQKTLDGNFPYAPSPNPEKPEALELGTKKLLVSQADLFLATDPDADRLGVVIRHQGKAYPLTGNQIASLCLYHICDSLTQKDQFPSHAICIKTIVTTELFKAIGESFGARCIDVLTGFKYIAEQIRLEEKGPSHYLFGAEESYGALFGTFVRDKDGISTSCLLAEAAAGAKRKGKTLLDQLYELYERYGIHREDQKSLLFSDSQEGMEQIQYLMQKLRTETPQLIGSQRIKETEDYLRPIGNLPSSDVLRFWLADGTKIVIRPSGTEPKVKIYIEVVGKEVTECDRRLKELMVGVSLVLGI